MEHKATILIVDDEPSARDTLEAFLFREGYDLAFADRGEEALTRLDELHPDVILLDVMMPGMDGFEVCQRLKADKRWRHIPVVLVTALDSKENLVRGLDAGTNDFLSKPVNRLELQARVRSLLRIKRQYDELEETLRLREELSNMIVHDMRNPLTAIVGYGQLLEYSLATTEDRDDLEHILVNARRLESFINDLLVVAKTQEKGLLLNRAPVDVGQLLLAVEQDQRIIAQSKKVQLVVDLPQESRQIPLDGNLVQRVLDNLVSNALKYSPPDSTTTLRLQYLETGNTPSAAGPLVRIQVADEGPGIPEEHRERIFGKFEIVKLRQEGEPQVGLGLAFCRMVVEAHGGRIFCEANQPTGSVFSVEI